MLYISDNLKLGEILSRPYYRSAAMNELQQAVDVVMGAVLRLLQDDGHQWSERPCSTCQAVSSIAGKPFGCVEYARRRAQQRAERESTSPNK